MERKDAETPVSFLSGNCVQVHCEHEGMDDMSSAKYSGLGSPRKIDLHTLGLTPSKIYTLYLPVNIDGINLARHDDCPSVPLCFLCFLFLSDVNTCLKNRPDMIIIIL